MIKTLALAISLVLAIASCKKKEDQPQPAEKQQGLAPPVTPAAGPDAENNPKGARHDGPQTDGVAKFAAGPGDEGDPDPTDGTRLQAPTTPSAGPDVDDTPPTFAKVFSSFGSKLVSCEAYSAAIAPFLAEMQTEYAQFQADAEAKGADAFDRFGKFLKKGAADLKKIKVEGVPIAAHTELVKAIGSLGDGFLALAAATRKGSEAKMTKAEKALDVATQRVATAFDAVKAACES